MKSCLIYILIIGLAGCKVADGLDEDGICDFDRAAVIAENSMEKAGFELEKYNGTNWSDSTTYILEYSPKNMQQPTGGGKFWIDKKTCKVDKRELYQ